MMSSAGPQSSKVIDASSGRGVFVERMGFRLVLGFMAATAAVLAVGCGSSGADDDSADTAAAIEAPASPQSALGALLGAPYALGRTEDVANPDDKPDDQGHNRPGKESGNQGGRHMHENPRPPGHAKGHGYWRDGVYYSAKPGEDPCLNLETSTAEQRACVACLAKGGDWDHGTATCS